MRTATSAAAVLFVALCLSTQIVAQELLLPDLSVRRSDLFDNDISRVVVPGRTHLRLSNGTMNIGDGKFYLFGDEPDREAGTQSVVQRIYREDGTFIEREAGRFLFHNGHNHIHIEDWAKYSLREILPDDGVGEVIAEGEKTSFCIIDLHIFDRNLPNFDSRGEFDSCASTIQGLSVGWIDVYDKFLDDQWIDITGVPDGEYWLESVVDPENNFRELNEDNNVERVKVSLSHNGGSEIRPDSYEPNASMVHVASRPEGGPNSPNLGPCNPKRTIENLTLSQRGEDDFYRFYNPAMGTEADFVRVDFNVREGDLELELLDSLGNVLGESREAGRSWEVVSLQGLEAGWYFARVTGRDNDISPAYTLTVNPSENESPVVEVIAPSAGEVKKPHGIETFVVRWRTADPESQPTWVTTYLSESRELDGSQLLLPTSVNTNGALGFHIINSADVPPGNYWVLCRVSDGGTTRSAWSEGTVNFVDIPQECSTLATPGDDCDQDGVIDNCAIDIALVPDCDANGVPDSCDVDLDENGIPDACERHSFRRGDANTDALVNISDPVLILSFLFLDPTPLACLEAGDTNNDGQLGLTDAIVLLNFLFGNGVAPAAPGVSACGLDPDAVGSSGDLGCVVYGSCL